MVYEGGMGSRRTYGLVVATAVSAPGSSSVLATSSPTATLAAIPSAPAGGPVSVIVGTLTVHVDRLVVFGGLSSGLVPSREVVVWAFAGGVILARAGPTVVWVLGVRGAIEFVGSAPEKGNPPIIGVAVLGWGGGVDIKEGDGGASLGDLERDDI